MRFALGEVTRHGWNGPTVYGDEPVVLGVKKVFKENSWKTTAKLCVRTFYSASIVVNGDLQWGPQDSYN